MAIHESVIPALRHADYQGSSGVRLVTIHNAQQIILIKFLILISLKCVYACMSYSYRCCKAFHQ